MSSLPNQKHEKIVKFILNGFGDMVLKKVSELPEDWDGFEIRQWMSDVFQHHFVVKMPTRRKREYDRTVATNNLI